MRTVALISCSNSKLSHKSTAMKLYTGALFKKSLLFSQKIGVNKIYILSAKYGLLELSDEIEPYNLTLNKMKLSDKKEWSLKVLNKLTQLEDLNSTNFIFLAGENYRKFLLNKIKFYQIPLQNLRIGEQLQFLNKAINE